jgi:hypothetical protein
VGPAGFAEAADAALELPLLLLLLVEDAEAALLLLLLAAEDADEAALGAANASSCDAPHTPDTVHVGWFVSGLMQ